MKVLLVSPHLPAPRTPQAGEKLVFKLVKMLSERHEIHLVARVNEDQEIDKEPISAYCKRIYPVFYKRPAKRKIFNLPKIIFSYYRLCERANEIANKEPFDVIHVEWTETGLFMKKKGRMVIEAHDVLTKPMERRCRNSNGVSRFLNFIVFRLTRSLECLIYSKFDKVFVLSQYDRNYLSSFAPSLDIAVLTYPASLDISDKINPREENSILFLGAMDRSPNVEAVLCFWNNVLPLIRKRVPDVKFYIVGSRPLPEVLKLAEKDPGTVVTGFVDEIEPYYKKAAVFAAPLLTGGGIIVKILDAMAAGTAVVSTSIGNEGVGGIDGKHLLIADTPADFADKVVRLLTDKALRQHIGQAGKDYIQEKYDIDTFRKAMDKLYL